MKLTIVGLTIFLAATFLSLLFSQSSVPTPPEDATLDFIGLAKKYGYKCEVYNLTTIDGYILTLFRIPGNQKTPVLLMHGFLASADLFLLRGRKSLPALLSDEGYDVWLGNMRGNLHARRHIRLDPNSDKEFWNFSFHEMAVIDLPVFIDFILEKNNVTSVSVIGHSLGNTLFYTLGSVLPEYNDKISIAIALGPVAYFNTDNMPAPAYAVFRLGPLFNLLFLAIGAEEIVSVNSLLVKFRDNVCALKGIGYVLCVGGIFSAIGGEDLEELEPEFFYALMGHYPTSSSRKTGDHILQIANRKVFAQYDHGRESNLKTYSSETPPLYDLSKVTMKVALMVGKNDKVTPSKNLELLKNQLPNVVSYYEMEREQFNHVDFVWGKNMNKYCFPHLRNLLTEYS